MEPIENIRITLGEIEQKVTQISSIYNVNEGVLSDEVAIEIEVKEMEIEELLGELPGIAELIKMEFTCDYHMLYEVLISNHGYKK